MKDWKYFIYVGAAVTLFVVVKLLAPKEYQWYETYAHDDKDPYGGYVFNELLPDLFKGNHVSHSYRTIYELRDSLSAGQNLIIVSSRFSPEKEDVKTLIRHIAQGGNAFISSSYFTGSIADTLKISTTDYLFNLANWQKKDSSYLKFANPVLDTMHHYVFQRDNIHNYFSKLDSTNFSVIARNDEGKPVTVSAAIGRGKLILNCTPMAFTNIYLLASDNHHFVSNTLSYLPNATVQWTEYYQMGRMESATPLRFILTNESLRWAYYITLIALLVFIIFEAKRKQRIIPVMKPLANTSLEFVTTIGNLYYQNGNHADLAHKKITFLLEHIRTHYFLNTTRLDEDFIKTLILKSGHSEELVRSLFKGVRFVQQTNLLSAEQLMDLNQKIEKFYARP